MMNKAIAFSALLLLSTATQVRAQDTIPQNYIQVLQSDRMNYLQALDNARVTLVEQDAKAKALAEYWKNYVEALTKAKK